MVPISGNFAANEDNLNIVLITYTLIITGEACGKGSLNTLQGDATSKGLTYTCYDLHVNNEVDKSTNAIASCVERVVEGVQNSKLTKNDTFAIDS